MNQAQILAVQHVLEKRLPQLDYYQRFALAVELAEAVDNKAIHNPAWPSDDRRNETKNKNP